MSANDPIAALLDHFDGKPLAAEHVEKLRSAFTALRARGSARDRLKAFEKALETKPRKGRPKEVLRSLEASNRWNAVRALRACKKATDDESEALRIVSKIFKVRTADLATWSKDHRLKHFAANEQANDARESSERYIAEAIAYYERHSAAMEVEDRASKRVR
jgi:hypothetical protein